MFPRYALKTKLPVILVASSVLVFGIWCTGMIGHASMHGATVVSSEIVMSSADRQECCNNGIFKNIGSWQSALVVAPREVRDGLLLIAAALYIAFAARHVRFRPRPPDIISAQSYARYARDNPDTLIFNHLRLAFARGILNPKIY